MSPKLFGVTDLWGSRLKIMCILVHIIYVCVCVCVYIYTQYM